MWELPRRLAEKLGLVKKTLTQNWLMASDVENLLYLANFEMIRVGREILWPVPTPLVGAFFNKFVVKLWPFDLLALTSVLVARPMPKRDRQRVEGQRRSGRPQRGRQYPRHF